MSRKHQPKKEPYVKTARDSRQAVHKYYRIDSSHSYSVLSGRCYKCGKITDAFCDRCNAWACSNHLMQKNELDFCGKCLEQNSP